MVFFPFIGLGLAWMRFSFAGEYLFFWPQRMLLPDGFVNRGDLHSQFLMMDCAIYCAMAFWFGYCLFLGYLLRNVKIGYVALATYPIVAVVMTLMYSLLGLFGYSVVLDGI